MKKNLRLYLGISVLLSFAIMGICLFFMYKRTSENDKIYETMLANSLTEFQLIHSISINSSNAQRCLLNLIISKDKEVKQSLRQSYEDYLSDNVENYSLLQLLIRKNTNEEIIFKNLLLIRANCNEKREVLLQMIDSQKCSIDSLGNYNLKNVRPLFENYLIAQKKLTEEIKYNALASSKYTISENDVFTKALLSIGLLPILLVLFFVFTTMLVVIFIFGKKEIDEARY